MCFEGRPKRNLAGVEIDSGRERKVALQTENFGKVNRMKSQAQKARLNPRWNE